MSAKEAQDFVNKKPENQCFRQKPQSDGLTASRGPSEEIQIDLLDFKQFGKTDKVVLIAMDPFSRKIWMTGLPSKKLRSWQAALNRCYSECRGQRQLFPTTATSSNEHSKQC